MQKINLLYKNLKLIMLLNIRLTLVKRNIGYKSVNKQK